MKQTVVLVGASGLVGRQVVDQFRDADVHICVRRPINDLPSSVKQHVSDSADWPDVVSGLKVDVAISCLGTTIRKAGSREAFRAVDLDLVLAIALASQKAGARHFITVSSVGAMPSSSSFYLKTKSEMEQGLRNIGFQRLDIMRPSLLTGGHRDEQRPGEAMGIMLSPIVDKLMIGPLKKYASTPSDRLAKAITVLAGRNENGIFIHENEAIRTLAG